MPQWSSGGLNLSAADLAELDLGDDAVLSFQDFAFVDDDNEWFGGGMLSGVESGDIWIFNVQLGYVTDSFQDWAVIFEDDANNVLFQGIFDEEAFNSTFVFTGDDILGGNSPPGNLDIVVQQADPTDPGVNMSIKTTAVRLRKRHAQNMDFPSGETGHEGFDP